MNQNANDFIGYEYKDVTVRHDMEAMYADSMPSFGWQMEGTVPSLSPNTVTMKFKRNRRITNKAELTRLQREFEAHVNEIEKLEDSKKIMPSAVAYIIGIVGTAFMAGSVFAITLVPPNVMLCIILAIPGFIGWVVSYFAFLKIQKSKISKAMPMIDRQYDEVYEICSKASALATV